MENTKKVTDEGMIELLCEYQCKIQRAEELIDGLKLALCGSDYRGPLYYPEGISLDERSKLAANWAEQFYSVIQASLGIINECLLSVDESIENIT